MVIDVMGDVARRQEKRNGVKITDKVELILNPGKNNPLQKKSAKTPEEITAAGRDLGDIGSVVGAGDKSVGLKNTVINKDDIGEPSRVIQMWHTGDQYGITIGGKFYEVDKEIWNLFHNAVAMNRSLKTEMGELERKLRVYQYGK